MTVTPATTLPLAQVRALPAGDQITGFYLLSNLQTPMKKNGEPYLLMNLQDATGSLEAKMWDSFEEFRTSARTGTAVKVEGRLDHYNGGPQLIVSRIRVATEEEVPDPRAFLPQSCLSPDRAREELAGLIGSVRNPHLGRALNAVFGDSEFLERFLAAPGGKKWHHSTIGGLAEHTVSLAKLADCVGTHYPDVDRDLLVAGALLHDVGKVTELSYDTAFDYTAEGRLLGHIVEGAMLVERRLAGVENFPEETRRQLLHLILSHHGADPTLGSPIKPSTLEALVLHFCDEIDSQLAAFVRERDSADGEDLSYIRLKGQYYYFKRIDGYGEPNGGEHHGG